MRTLCRSLVVALAGPAGRTQPALPHLPDVSDDAGDVARGVLQQLDEGINPEVERWPTLAPFSLL